MRGVGADLRVVADEQRFAVRQRSEPLTTASDVNSTAAGVAGRIDNGAVDETDLVARDRDGAAGLAGADARRIESAADGNDTARAALEPDHAVLRADRARFDDAIVVDHGGEQGIPGLRGQDDRAAVGLDQLSVGCKRIDRGLVHRETDETAAGELQGDLIPRSERNRTEARCDDAFVHHLRTDKRHVAAFGRADRALVHHRPCAAGVRERVAACEEIGIGQTQRGRDDATNVYLGAGAEQHAVRIEDEDLPVRRETAEDHGRVLSENAIERDRTSLGLLEHDRFAGADPEALPVDRETRRGLLHRQRTA